MLLTSVNGVKFACPEPEECDIITGYCLKREEKKINQQETLPSKR